MITKMELVADQNGQPVMRVTEKDGTINQIHLCKGYQIHLANEFLRSQDLGIIIKFESYSQYGGLIVECSEEIAKRNGVAA